MTVSLVGRRFDVREHLLFEVHVLRHRLDDEVGVRDGFLEVGRPLDALEGFLHFFLADLVPVDAALEVVSDPLEAVFDELRLDVAQHDVVARPRGHLCDSVAHTPRTENRDLHT